MGHSAWSAEDAEWGAGTEPGIEPGEDGHVVVAEQLKDLFRAAVWRSGHTSAARRKLASAGIQPGGQGGQELVDRGRLLRPAARERQSDVEPPAPADAPIVLLQPAGQPPLGLVLALGPGITQEHG